MSKNLLAVLFCVFLALCGCNDKGDTSRSFDLAVVESQVRMGMNEFQVVNATGAPNKIDKHDDYRDLRYNSKDGNGYLIVRLRQNVVVEVSRKD